jgi:hypothetical protein
MIMDSKRGNDEPDDFVAEVEKWIEEENRKERPDYRNTVYCDKHLGVKMVLASSWSSIEYGDTSVDLNPTLLWYCPKPDCDRHYEPSMFGYYVNEPGRRLDGPKQPRGNHPGLPFMYIGKSGEGRRYKCPYYKCLEEGPIVAETVEDEHVEPPPADPLTNLKKAERQRAEELLIFQFFASACGLPIDEESPENREPNYPDILCTISGQRYWFELGEIIHKDVAEKVNPKRRAWDGGFSYDQEQPFVELINSKAAKTYTTDGLPVDLILHFDLRFGTTASVRRLCERHAELLKSLTTAGSFNRVWVFNVANKGVVLQCCGSNNEVAAE